MVIYVVLLKNKQVKAGFDQLVFSVALGHRFELQVEKFSCVGSLQILQLLPRVC